MKAGYTLTLTLTVLVMCFTLFHSVHSEAKQASASNPGVQERQRMILKKTDFNPPVWIKRVKIKNRSVPLDKKFEEDDDWLREFTVVVFNASEKTVSHVGIEMLFRHAKPSKSTPAAWQLEYGPNPFHSGSADSAPTSTVPSVMAGGEIELKLSPDELVNLTDFLTAAGFDDKIHSVEIRILSIGFTDGTAWFGKMLRPDPTSPSKWRIETASGVAAQKRKSTD